MLSIVSFLLLIFSCNALTVFANLTCTADSFTSILPSNTTVTVADEITKYGTSSHTGFNISISRNITSDALPICVVELNVQSSANTSFNTGVLLPNNWNGRLIGTGNPGFGGGLRWAFQANSLKYGPAVTVSTDTGHVGAPNNISFAIDNPDGIVDWAYRSLQWVENGIAPEHLIASKWNNDTLEDGLVMQRPLCPYPQKSVYGSGDWKSASSWSCQEGETMVFPAVNGSLGTVTTVDATVNGTKGGKNAALGIRGLGEDAIRLGGWGVLALLVVGNLF